MAELRWYVFESYRYGLGARYIGKSLTTLAEVKTAFPHSRITGNLVTIFTI